MKTSKEEETEIEDNILKETLKFDEMKIEEDPFKGEKINFEGMKIQDEKEEIKIEEKEEVKIEDKNKISKQIEDEKEEEIKFKKEVLIDMLSFGGLMNFGEKIRFEKKKKKQKYIFLTVKKYY